MKVYLILRREAGAYSLPALAWSLLGPLDDRDAVVGTYDFCEEATDEEIRSFFYNTVFPLHLQKYEDGGWVEKCADEIEDWVRFTDEGNLLAYTFEPVYDVENEKGRFSIWHCRLVTHDGKVIAEHVPEKKEAET